MIQIERYRLDPRERDRWRDALAAQPIVSRRAFWTEPEVLVFVGLAWLAVVAVTFGPWLDDPSPLAIGTLRVLATGAAVITFRAAFHMDVTRADGWPEGRFLFAWGFVEVEREIARIVPASELRIGVRPRRGLLPVRLVLGDAAWSTTIAIDTGELARVVAALGDDHRLERIAHGYRDARPPIDGASEVWPFARPVRELAWAAPVCLAMTLAPMRFGTERAPHVEVARGPVVSSMPERDVLLFNLVRPEWATHLGGPNGEAIEPRVDFDRCTGRRTTRVATDYLEAALRNPSVTWRGAPSTVPRDRATIWAQCTWRADPEHGTFDSVDVRWGIDRYGRTLRSRTAHILSSHVLDAIGRCRPDGEPVDVGPESLASRSARLAARVVLHDVMRDLPEGGATCERDIAWSIETAER